MNLPRTIRITERKLGKEQAVGLCWHGKVPHIEIDPRQPSKSRLASVLWADRWRRVQK